MSAVAMSACSLATLIGKVAFAKIINHGSKTGASPVIDIRRDDYADAYYCELDGLRFCVVGEGQRIVYVDANGSHRLYETVEQFIASVIAL